MRTVVVINVCQNGLGLPGVCAHIAHEQFQLQCEDTGAASGVSEMG